MQGKTWKKADVPKDNSTWMIENALAGYTDANGTQMQMQIFRTRTGTSLQSWSSDGGYNWTVAVNSTLPNPNSRVRPHISCRDLVWYLWWLPAAGLPWQPLTELDQRAVAKPEPCLHA